MAERHEPIPNLIRHELSKRETEIAKLIIEGYTNTQILGKLVISKSTLKTHLNTIYKKAPDLHAFREKLQL